METGRIRLVLELRFLMAIVSWEKRKKKVQMLMDRNSAHTETQIMSLVSGQSVLLLVEFKSMHSF